MVGTNIMTKPTNKPPRTKPLCWCGLDAVARQLCWKHYAEDRRRRSGVPVSPTFRQIDWSGVTGIWICAKCNDRGGPYFTEAATKAGLHIHTNDVHIVVPIDGRTNKR